MRKICHVGIPDSRVHTACVRSESDFPLLSYPTQTVAVYVLCFVPLSLSKMQAARLARIFFKIKSATVPNILSNHTFSVYYMQPTHLLARLQTSYTNGIIV